jgi:hypothetical protein
MLLQKLIGTHQPAEIEFVGSFTTLFTGNSVSTWTLSYGNNLTGGLASSPIQGDLVIVIIGSSNSPSITFTAQTSGYTKIANLYANANLTTADACFAVFAKIMNNPADTDFQVNFSSNCYPQGLVYCLRGVNPTVPQDVTPTTAISTSIGVPPDPPAITPTTIGSAIVACGVSAGTGNVSILSSSSLSNFVTAGEGFARLGIGTIYNWSSGSVDPAQFDGGSNTRATASVTMALRPN